mmetsp:Transcript_5550/g.20880  ORF Transcript_5550/g.20880 Transcript_5550/m.20880 type:complete len:129 (+) Transcript_5550:155-541(+)
MIQGSHLSGSKRKGSRLLEWEEGVINPDPMSCVFTETVCVSTHLDMHKIISQIHHRVVSFHLLLPIHCCPLPSSMSLLIPTTRPVLASSSKSVRFSSMVASCPKNVLLQGSAIFSRICCLCFNACGKV